MHKPSGARVKHRCYKPFVVCLLTGMAATAFSAPDAARQAELLYLLKHDCGSCHGMTRKGGLGPPLLPENLDNRPQQLMVDTVLEGRPGTPMPPWRGELTEQDAQWLVEAMLRGEGL
jgi:cytochrome c55X